MSTVLPEYINTKHILRFDQNFECGNLDSVYIHNTQEYNLLMKVDTNTKGNMYWFMFKVYNFKVGLKYKFNICNFTRSMDKFYKDRMNVVTRAERICSGAESKKSGVSTEAKEDWRYDTCENVMFESSEIPKSSCTYY